MKEFVEKLIARLEIKQKIETSFRRDSFSVGFRRDSFSAGVLHGYRDTISTINKLAEEYKSRIMIDGQYCWQTCSATEHCKECNRLSNGSIDYYENYDCLAEEYNNGWIACSERLPEANQKVLTCDKDGWISVNVNMPYMGVGNDFKCGYYVAWMPLPAPYQKGSE